MRKKKSKLVEECYDKFAQEYDDQSHSSIQYNELLETPIVLEFIKEDNPNYCTSFLDVGVGTGRWLEILYKLGYRDLAGVDLSEGMIKKCKNKMYDLPFNPLLIKADAENLSSYFSSERFDIIIAAFCDHINNHKKAFSEMYKILKRYGKLIASFPDKELAMILRPQLLGVSVYETRFRLNDGNEYVLPSWVYYPNEIKELLSEIGYKDIRIKRAKVSDGKGCQPTKYIVKVAELLKKPVENLPVVMVVKATKY